MRRKWGGSLITAVTQALLFALLATSSCHGARQTAQRSAQRRKDTSRSDLYLPTPSAESLQALAQAMGAAGFESYTEGKALVKRLIPADSQPDLDVVEHQGVIGRAGIDFPAFPNIPNTGFNCKNVPTGYYADLETDCQVFHICDTSRKISFLCPNGTIFSQSHLICDWWFKVDCASAPALYESSAEYYSNEQKKSQKIIQNLSKNSDLQQLSSDTHIRPETKKTPINVPSTTEKLLRHRQRIQENVNTKATSRSFQALLPDSTFNPTQRTQASTAFEKRRKNLVQLIANNFGNVPSRTTLPTYTEASTYRPTSPAGDYNSIREMQVAAESASFANNNNRQFLQDYNNKNYRPYPVYTPNLTARLSKAKSNPTLTTLYDIRDKNINLAIESTSKRPTLVPYTKSYTSSLNDKREPYTRPGVSLLKDFLDKEKNKTAAITTTEKVIEATERIDFYGNKNSPGNKVTIETKDTYESVTKIPQTTRPDNNYYRRTASSDRLDVYANTNQFLPTTESSYQERRERLMRKLNLDAFSPTETTSQTTITEKFYGDLPNRPGLVVPPSLTPKTLHTLAIYYATALDNLSTTMASQETETTTAALDEYETNEDGIPPFALFSRHTIDKYSNLFAQGLQNPELLENIKLDPNGTFNELADDLTVQQSQNPLATSPQIRELAQVFTHALSAYLQDPVQFRKVLSDIRPTHPSFGDMLTTTEEPSNTEPTTTVNEEDDEILGFSDDNKIRPALVSLRDPKALNIATEYNTVSAELTTTPKSFRTDASNTFGLTTSSSPFRCCGRISASYTSASTPESATSPQPFTNTIAANVNTLANNTTDSHITTTENSYIPKYGGFQNNTQVNNSPYGREVNPVDAKPLSEYIEVTNLPTAWGVDASGVTAPPATNTHANIFESKKILTTTSLPATTAVYFTETDSIELENEEELQRAHSQSFVTPQSNNLRQGKQINIDDAKTTVRKPSEELEAPTLSDFDVTPVQTTIPPSTTDKTNDAEFFTTVSSFSSNAFTSPEGDKTTYQFQWPSTFESWQSTVIDPITLNDNLNPSGPEQSSQPVVRQTNSWINNAATTPATEYTRTSEQSYSSSDTVELTTPGTRNDDRIGKLLRDPTSTEAAQDITTITDTVVEKAKEIMGGMNATTTEKLMNVMKKTKSKTVRRLILLLIQTCDDDHNTTAEASKKALLEALMAVSQKDVDEIIKEDVTDAPTTQADIETVKTNEPFTKSDVTERQEIKSRTTDRRGKSLTFDPNAINSLSNPSTPENLKPTEFIVETASTTQSPKTLSNRRGTKKFLIRTSPVDASVTKPPAASVHSPIAEARTAAQSSDIKTAADTRALELLRSLYTIAARWG